MTVDETSPVSQLAGDVDESPTRSFLETSFFSQLRSLHVTPARRNNRGNAIVPHEDTRYLDDFPKVVRTWSNWIHRSAKVLLVLIVTTLWPIGVWSFHKLEQETDSTFHPVPGSLSQDANEAFGRTYPSDWSNPLNPALYVVLESKFSNLSMTNPISVAYQAAFNWTHDLNKTILSTSTKVHSDSSTNTTESVSWARATSFYSLKESKLHWMAQALATPKGHTVLCQVQYLLPLNGSNREGHERVSSLMDAMQDFAEQHQSPYFTASFTGLKFFSNDLRASTHADLRRMDLIVLPIALGLIGCVLPKAKATIVWIIPLATMISTVTLWSIVLRFVAKNMQITQFTPSIMMSLSLGMGIDYTLFLLARYLEFAATRSRGVAVAHMLRHGGHVLLLSGLTLMCTFLGLCFLPLSMLQSIGVGAAVAIACALLVNLTVVPALLYTDVGKWIVDNQSDSDCSVDQEDSDEREDDATIVASPSRAGMASPSMENISPPLPSVWFRMAKQLLHSYRGVIILLITCQLLLPVAYFSSKINSSLSFDLLLPSDSPSLKTFHSLGATLGEGRLNPYRILFDGAAFNLTLTSNEGFKTMHMVIEELIALDDDTQEGMVHLASIEKQDIQNRTQTELSSSNAERNEADEELLVLQKPLARAAVYTGVAIIKNTRVPHLLYSMSKVCSNNIRPHCPSELMHVIDEIDKVVTSHDRYSTYVDAVLGVSPFSDEGIAWLEGARATIKQMERKGMLSGVKVHIQGPASIAFDSVQAVHAAFPTMIAITTVVVFLLMGLFFRSIFTPLRSILSIGLTLGFSFGLSVLVFQRGIFNWSHVRVLTSVGDEMCWLVPIMAFSIVVGLALDYDVFLGSRILEYRNQGYEHKSSVAAGLHSTGSIITAAGLIMAFAFGSLMFSASPVLYQWSFVLTTAVLLDTFVIRTVVVPIITGMAGRTCWWPRNMPEGRIVYAAFQDDADVTGFLRTLEETSEYEPLAPLP
jgi:uncharacterized membrane protein YdfJ with MMPL/SSD domain